MGDPTEINTLGLLLDGDKRVGKCYFNPNMVKDG